MRNPRTTSLLVLLVALPLGCARQARSLIAVEIDGAAIPGLASITLTATPVGVPGGRSASFDWKMNAAKMKVGLYVDFDAAEASVRADGYPPGGASRIAYSNAQTVGLTRGQTTVPVMLTLMAGDSGADAGSSDGTTDTNAADRSPDGMTPPVLSWSTENLEKDAVSASSSADVAIHPTEGHVLVAWTNGNVIKIGRYDSGARTWATTTIDHGDTPLFPQVAMAANGHAIVAWRNDSDLTSTALQGIWAAHSVDSGRTWGAPVSVYRGPVHRSDLALAMAASGDARVAWSAYINNETLTAVWSARYVATSRSWSGAMLQTTSCSCRSHPRIAMDEQGAGLLVWNDSGEASLWGAAFAPTTAALTVHGLMPSSVSAGDPSPAMVPGAGGRGVVVWDEGGSVWLGEYDPAKGGWLPAARAVGEASASYPVVAVDGAGNIAVAWANRDPSGRWDVAAAVRPAGGTTWNAAGLETMNLAMAGDAPAPQIGYDGIGNAHVLWRRRTAPSGETWGVYSRRWTAADGRWDPETELSIKTGLTVSPDPDLAVAKDGRAAAAFHYLDPANTRGPDAYKVFASLYR